jgi:hypothetical protein
MDDMRQKAQMQEANASLKQGPAGRSYFEHGSPYAFNKNTALFRHREDLLKPTQAERATHAQFLKQQHVGLVRLFPSRVSPYGAKVVTVDTLTKEQQNAAIYPGSGAFYSFTTKNHLPGARADIWLKDGNLVVGFGSEVLGALTILGDVPIDSLTIDSPGVRTLATYSPPSESEQAESEHQRFKDGVVLANYPFQTQRPVYENTTYALRSIAYGRSDLLVAFRVVKQDSDGSVLFLWKRLSKFSTPKFKEAARK